MIGAKSSSTKSQTHAHSRRRRTFFKSTTASNNDIGLCTSFHISGQSGISTIAFKMLLQYIMFNSETVFFRLGYCVLKGARETRTCHLKVMSAVPLRSLQFKFLSNTASVMGVSLTTRYTTRSSRHMNRNEGALL